jgi:hypothetical protein
MTDRSARWIRVSSGGQSEETQLTEVIDPYISRMGYQDSGILYRLHDVSAAKGEHQAAQDQVIQDISDGRYQVLVVADSSRIERRDEGDELILFLARVRVAGGRVEFVAEPALGKSDIAGKVLAVLSQHGNAEYVRKLTTNISRGIRGVVANGAFLGSEPWGFAGIGPKRDRRLVPTHAAIEYGPQILTRVANGASLGDVARWLTAEGVPSGRGGGVDGARWWARSVAAVVRSRTLIGEYACSYTVTWTDETGKHTETLRWAHRFEPVVDHDLWLTANRALDDRGAKWHAGRSREGRPAAEPLSGAARCHHCDVTGADSPMYRLSSGNLRCTGTGPDRGATPCGLGSKRFMLPVDVARTLADKAFGQMTGSPLYFMYVRTRVAGNAAEIEIERDRLNKDYAVSAQNPDRSARKIQLAAIDERLDELDAMEIIPDDDTLVRRTDYPDYAAYWAGSDPATRRSFLRRGEFRITYGMADGTERAAERGYGVWIDHLDPTEENQPEE